MTNTRPPFDEDKFEQAVAAFMLISDTVNPPEFFSAFGQTVALRMSGNRKEIDNQLKCIRETIDVALQAIDTELMKMKGDANVQ